MMRHLWQRIFAYSLALVLVSQAAVYFLHLHTASREEIRRFISENTRSLASAMEDKSLAVADDVARIYNHRRNRVWLEDAQGRLIGGALPEGGRPEQGTPVESREGGLAIYEIPPVGGTYMAAMPVALRDGPASIFVMYRPPQDSHIRSMFFRGLIVLSLIALLIALWMARRVSKPLRELRDEVMHIAGGDLEKRVSVKGHDEITDVARAVNLMADSLAKHIRSMRELIANISHEMRSPLARIQVSMALLEEDIAEKGNPQAKNRIAMMNEELDHLNSLIGATLLSSKLDLQSPSPMTAPVALSELCAEACRRHAPLFARRNQRFTHAIQPGIVLKGDETLLATLVSNLLDNAAKYTGENGLAALRLDRNDGRIRLEVENSHDPLPQTVLDHIFEPFYRGGIATGNGVGLGLSLVRRIAALHNGEAVAENTAGGVRFAVRFPDREK